MFFGAILQAASQNAGMMIIARLICGVGLGIIVRLCVEVVHFSCKLVLVITELDRPRFTSRVFSKGNSRAICLHTGE